MTIEPEQKPTEHRKANGLHDDVVTLKVDVATLKEQGKNFATKEDIAKLETQIAQARAENNENNAKLETKIAKLETKIAKLEAQIAQAQAENKEDNAKLRAEIKEDINELLHAFNRFAVRVIVVLVSVMVALLGMVATALF